MENKTKSLKRIIKGITIGVDGQDCILTKVSRKGMSGVMNGDLKPGSKYAITPIYRLYYERPDGTQDYQDTAISTDDFTIVIG